jgi:hypothetical protein
MPSARPALRVTTAILGALAAAALLAGCSGTGGSTAKDTPKASHSAGASSNPSAGATDAASASPTPTATPTPVTLQQGEVWTAQQVYAFNPNFAPDPSYKVQSGTAAESIVKLKGVSFGWVNQSSNDTVEVAVAHPAPSTQSQQSGQFAADQGACSDEQTAAAHYCQVIVDGAPAGTVAYFNASVGTLQLFTATGYWVVIDSKIFLEPGDSYQIGADVAGNLK